MLSRQVLEKVTYYCFGALLFLGTNVQVAFGYKSEMISTVRILNVHPVIWILLLIAIQLFYLQRKPFLRKRILVFLLILVAFNKLTGRGIDFSFLLNVLVLPLVVSYILDYPFLIDRNKVQNIILRFFVMECSLAVIERIFKFNTFPVISDSGVALDWTWEGFRSTAFQSHPLSNALIVFTIMNFILCSSLSVKKKYYYWLLGLIALLCFNTRSSIVGCCLLFGIFSLKKLLERGIGKRERIMLMACMCLFPVVGYVLLTHGLGNRLLELGLFDDSSAAVRVKVFEIFDFFQLKDFILGYPAEKIDDILLVSGLSDYCIENYWLVYILKFGIIFTILIAYFYGVFFVRLLGNASFFYKVFLLIGFLLISSTNNSLATDSIALTVLTLCCYCLPPCMNSTNRIKYDCNNFNHPSI